jgi:hypothetical protein
MNIFTGDALRTPKDWRSYCIYNQATTSIAASITTATSGRGIEGSCPTALSAASAIGRRGVIVDK